ncbi:MAG: type 1 glutamine amidotransferase [Thermodesulfobacteriota bacterium]|nr:type 1 glutamine amidotransferase [Thermodesulfobacteriota bacterium]
MSMDFLVLQHLSWEGPGRHLIRAAKKHGAHLHMVKVWREPIPDVGGYDGLIVLGGSPNVDQEEAYPFLRAEKERIRRVIDEEMAYLGFCLGHQLLAHALGARVGPNFCRSVGFTLGHLTKEGRKHPVFKDSPRSFQLFKWHSQAVLPPVPKEVEVLVTSPACQVEAISVQGRPHVLGLQFDNQSATVSDIRLWLEADEEWLSQPPGIDPTAVLRDASRYQTAVGLQFQTLFSNYLNLISRYPKRLSVTSEASMPEAPMA